MKPRGCSLIVGAFSQTGAQIASVLGPDLCMGTARGSASPDVVPLDLASLTAPDADGLLGRGNADAVYCVGGMTDVERCEQEADLAMRVNCEGPAVLAAAAAARAIPFVYFSTEYIFDGFAGPYGEADAASPINAYGKSKWMGELAVSAAHPSPLILRTTVVYGPDARERNFVCALRRTLAAGKAVRVADDQISTPTYNRDLAANTVALVRAGASGVFHVAGPERISRFEFARRAARLMGFSETLVRGAPTSELGQRARRPLDAGLSAEKLGGFAHHVPMRTLDEALRHWMNV